MPKQVPCTSCFSVLGIKSRTLMYSYIKKKGRVTVGEVVDYIKLAQPTVSYHLKEMKDAGLLTNEKIGKEVFYELNDECPVHKRVCVISKVNF